MKKKLVFICLIVVFPGILLTASATIVQAIDGAFDIYGNWNDFSTGEITEQSFSVYEAGPNLTLLQTIDDQFGIYEDWRKSTIRSDRWTARDDPAHEVKRQVIRMPFTWHNWFEMRYRREGVISPSEGLVGASQRMNAQNGSAINKMEADFRVMRMVVKGCPANINIKTRIRPAQIAVGGFNDGSSSGPGDLTGEYFVRILANREADSTDPTGVLTVGAFVFRCIDAPCSNAYSTIFDLNVAKVRMGELFTLRAIWDEPNNRFLVGVNDGPDVILAYDPELNQKSGQGIAQFGIQLVASNCPDSRTVTDAETWVTEVRTNPSAIIP